VGLLKRNVRLESGLIAPTVYYNISSFQGNKENVTYHVYAYASRESYFTGFPLLFMRSYNFPLTSSDIIGNGYYHLKETEEFKDAEDVID